MIVLVLLIVVVLLVSWVLLWVRFGPVLRAVFREPVLATPVFILECDDWGAGDHGQADSLRDIREILESCKLSGGGHPVMTLGVNLAAPRVVDTEQGYGFDTVTLSAAESRETLLAMLEGHHCGLMPLQLHGFTHFSPSQFQSYLDTLKQGGEAGPFALGAPLLTEQLPSSVQSRWLPAQTDSESQAQWEAQEHQRLLGIPPCVAVPPTFVWRADIESGWAAAGVKTVVTPGSRAVNRTSKGFEYDKTNIANGDLSESGLLCLVRSVYFEPCKGVGSAECRQGIERSVACGRPAIIETHRWNYIHPDPSTRAQSFAELRALIAWVNQQHPEWRSLSTAAIAQEYRRTASGGESKSGVRFERDMGARALAWRRRLTCSPIPGVLCWASGLMAALWFGQRLWWTRKRAFSA
ncbi:hypothetical protein D0544_05585 [Aestuariirhabdus litorea]|uniref:Glycosyl hydrolase n=1 Tax=Aestuariirhabdus litorea TaxID=2528527 RepID=A0A3P3VSB0_9GAMM|nr:hypothetical protein D0544_05585 [Aestuariirhabdus litorea]